MTNERTGTMRKWLGCLLLIGSLGACGGGTDDTPVTASGKNSVEAVIDKRGGSLELEARARVSIPENALDQPVKLRAERGDLDTLPRTGGNFETVGDPLIVTPHGLELRRPASIEMVIRDQDTPARELRVLRLDDEDDTSWEELRDLRVREPGDSDLEDDTLQDKRRIAFNVDGFSIFLPVRVTPEPEGACVGQEEGFVCREAAGPCDVPETCDGESSECPEDGFAPASEVCRPSAGTCDVAESCSGDSAACPVDVVRDAGRVCRSADGPCDVREVCDGVAAACPDDQVRAQGAICRSAQGPCDATEVCSGDSTQCPSDAFLTAGTVCRSATGACDTAEVCSGSAASCPANAFAAQGTACSDGLFCTDGDACDGQGACIPGDDPCAAFIGDDTANCSQACVEGDGTHECSGPEPEGSYCFTATCATSSCQAGTCAADVPCPVFVNIDGGVDGFDAGVDGGASCGTDWGSACRTVQRGSQMAEQSGNGRVFVAVGRYATDGTGSVLTMAQDVAYYGGFVGTEDHQDERPPFATDAGLSTDGGAGGVPPDAMVTTVLGGNGSPAAVVIGASGARLDGFAIMDMDGGPGDLDAGVPPSGDGMRNVGEADGGAPLTGLTVANARFYGSSTFGGAGRGMYNQNVADLTVEGAQFDHNRQGTGGLPNGSALQVVGGSDVRIRDSAFVANTLNGADTLVTGAAVAVNSVDGLELSGVLFRANQATSNQAALGGGLYSTGTVQSLTDVRFENNFVGASSFALGGGMVDTGSESTLSNVTFSGNVASAAYSAGGGAYGIESSQSLTTTLSNVTFENNAAQAAYTALGGGLQIFSDTPAANVGVHCNGCRFENNATGGGPRRGGGIYAEGSGVDLTLATSVLADNRAGYGGGLDALESQVTVTDSAFVGNVVGSYGRSYAGGGGVAIENGVLQVSGSQFSGNQSLASPGEGGSSLGGGLYALNTQVSLTDSDFVSNVADLAGYGGAQGGGVAHVGSAPLTISNVGFVGNQASFSFYGGSGLGGGLYVEATGSSYTVTNTTFVDNTSGLYAASGSGEVHNSIFANQSDANIGGSASPNTSHLCTTTPELPPVTDTQLDDPAFQLVRTDGGHVYLPDGSASPCFDMGDDTLADGAFGVGVWATLTTRLDGTLDTSPVDAGRHYATGALVIRTFEVGTGTDLLWNVRAPAGTLCRVGNAGDTDPPFQIDPVTNPTGTLTGHGLDTAEGGVTLRCETPLTGEVVQASAGGMFDSPPF